MSVDTALAEFKPESVTHRLLGGIYGVLPYAPEFPHYTSVADAVRQLDPSAGPAVVARAEQIAATDARVTDILWMAKVMDMGDSGYAIYTGVSSAVRFFFGDRSKALETDNQQRNDAVLKALGLSYLVFKAYPGSVKDKAEAFRTSPTGQALAMYYAAIEVALPFADNAALKGGAILGDLYGKYGATQMARLAQIGGSGHADLAEAEGVLNTITGNLRKVVDLASNHITPVANAAKPFVPKAMAGGDVLAGVVANAADVLPVYRLLGARLAAETAARLALAGE
jgi:hypothetical protein